METATLTKNLDRWDLISDRIYGVADLAWAIAEANPELADNLVLPAGITLIIPELATLRRPLTAANPAREDDGEFLPLPTDDTPTPIDPGGGGGGGDYVPLSAVGVTVAPLFNSIVPVGNLPPYPTLASLGGASAADVAAAIALMIPLSAIGVANGIAPLDNTLKVPSANLPAYPTLASLNGVSASAFSAAIALTVPTAAVGAANGVAPLDNTLKVPASFLPAYPTLDSLGAASDAELAAAIGTVIPNSARNAANGVAGLDVNSFISASQIPLSVQFQALPRSNVTIIDLNSISGNHAATKWLDGSVANLNVPSFSNSGTVTQYDSLSIPAPNLYKYQNFISPNGRTADRVQNNGVWGTWKERAYINQAQSFTALQEFIASAAFKGGIIPVVTTTLTQAGVNANGEPVYWLVNASAISGNRLKSITITSNGNIVLTHHADDGSPGNSLSHTASGNILTNGTVRPGSGATAFTGASFVPGSTYFRSDLLGDSGTGCLTYSDGSVWRRVGDGTPITETAKLKKTLTGTTAATQGGLVNIPHGLTGSKIINVSGIINHLAGNTIPIGGRQTNYATFWASDTTNFILTNEAGNSAAILSKTFAVVIEYSP